MEAAAASSQRHVEAAVTHFFADGDWAAFDRDGYLALGRELRPDEAAALAEVGRATGSAELRDRIGSPELFSAHELLHHPVQHEVARRLYGPDAAVGVARLRFGGPGAGRWRQEAPAHQDEFDRDDVALIVVALGSSAQVEVLRRSHRLGAHPEPGAALDAPPAPDGTPPPTAEHVALAPGEALLVHRWLIHRISAGPADACAITLADGRARDRQTGHPQLPLLRGTWPAAAGATAPAAAVERATQQFAEAQRYARSLESALAEQRAAFAEVEEYARSLEAALAQERAQ